jgi:DNA-directed RNA polymerase specialized sigma24 family protein
MRRLTEEERARGDRVVRDNLGLLHREASRFGRTSRAPFEDLLSEAMLAALEADRYYRPEAGRWATYLGVCVRRRMLKYARLWECGGGARLSDEDSRAIYESEITGTEGAEAIRERLAELAEDPARRREYLRILGDLEASGAVA